MLTSGHPVHDVERGTGTDHFEHPWNDVDAHAEVGTPSQDVDQRGLGDVREGDYHTLDP